MSRSRFVIWGHPRPRTLGKGYTSCVGLFFYGSDRIYYFARLALAFAVAPAFEMPLFLSFGGFFSCSLSFFSFSGWFSVLVCLVRLPFLLLLLLLLGGLVLLALWRFGLRLCLRPAVCCVLVRVVRWLVLPVLLVSVVCVVWGFGSSCLVGGFCCSLFLPFVVSFWGFPLVRFSFSVRSRSSVRRVSVPFRRVVGLALARGCCSWLLRSSVRSFSGSVVWCGFASRSREKCLCLRCLAFGRLCGLGSSWLVFCLWLRLVRLRACRALVSFWGFVPLFLRDRITTKTSLTIRLA